MWFWRLQLVLKEKIINKGFLSSHQLENCDYAVMPSLVFGAGLIWMASLIFFYAHGHLVKELILSQSVSSIVEHGLLFPDVGCLLRYVRPVPSPES